MEIVRVSVFGLCGIFLALLVKEVRPEYGLYVTLAAGVGILFFSADKLTFLLDSLKKLEQYLPLDATYLRILLKMIGMTYVGQFAAGICKDAGYSAVANQVEIFCRLSVLAVSMPVLTVLLETIYEFLG